MEASAEPSDRTPGACTRAPTDVIVRVDAESEALHPPLAEHGEVEPVGGGRAAGLDVVDAAHAMEDLEGGYEPGVVHVVDEQLRPSVPARRRGRREEGRKESAETSPR